jgi:carbon monoxide dehydrogenase subunit G
MIDVQRQITVPSPPDVVWRLLSDPVAVVRCVPGASLDGEVVDGRFAGQLVVSFGALRVPFRGTGTLEFDQDARQGTLSGRGRDNSGGTRFRVTADFSVGQAGGPALSELAVQGRVELTGKLAPLMEAGADAVAEIMLDEFTRQVALACRPADAAAQPAPSAAAATTSLPAGTLLLGILARLGRSLGSMLRRSATSAGAVPTGASGDRWPAGRPHRHRRR